MGNMEIQSQPFSYKILNCNLHLVMLYCADTDKKQTQSPNYPFTFLGVFSHASICQSLNVNGAFKCRALAYSTN